MFWVLGDLTNQRMRCSQQDLGLTWRTVKVVRTLGSYHAIDRDSLDYQVENVMENNGSYLQDEQVKLLSGISKS